MAETFAERLRRLRSEHGLSVSQLAHAVRRSEATIRKLESGDSKEPLATVALRLARVLEVTAWYLIFGEDDPQETELRSMAARIEALERLALETAALGPRVSMLEARAEGDPPHTAPE